MHRHGAGVSVVRQEEDSRPDAWRERPSAVRASSTVTALRPCCASKPLAVADTNYDPTRRRLTSCLSTPAR